ncbi:hypothetical protein CLAIMM_06259 [Cladophialophora immunda]|nr:hypothetical protein CLAIMM_06259 [Cladophialophora immunda]
MMAVEIFVRTYFAGVTHELDESSQTVGGTEKVCACPSLLQQIYQHKMRVILVGVAYTAAFAGFLFHGIYNRYEPTLGSFLSHIAALSGCVGLVALQLVGDYHFILQAVPLFAAVYLTTLGLSISIYRLSFLHPLSKFPGPWYAKLTKWTGVYHSWTGYLHVWLPSLHAKYGDIVRIGPNELSFADAGAVKYLHGPQGARLTKGPYYDTEVYSTGGKAMPSTRDWEDHRFKKHDGEIVDFGSWCDYFAFDAMGELAFDYKFGLMNDDGPKFYSACVRSGIKMMHIISSVPWISPVAYLLPFGDADVKKHTAEFRQISKNQYDERRQRGTGPNDLFTHLIPGDKDGYVTRELDLEADSPVLFIAGSDTTSLASTFLFYFLTKYPTCYERVKEEVDRAWDGEKPLEGYMLGPETCPYINGAIYESMRLLPPGPNGFQRRTGKGGHLVNGTFIPEYTQVSSNVISLHHDERNWTRASEFIPERWNDATRDPSWTHDVRAFQAFTGGTFSCAGRALAFLELRLFVAKVVRNFDITMPDDFDDAGFIGSIKSYQSLMRGPLMLKIKSRERK